MKQEVREEETRAEERIHIVKLVSTILPNELLFCLFFVLAEWRQKITLVKLCKMVDTSDQKLIRDHVNMLLRCGLLGKEGEQYQISTLGKKAITLLNDFVGNIDDTTWTVASYGPEIVFDVTSAGQSVVPVINSADVPSLAAASELPDKKTISDRGVHDEKTAASAEMSVATGGEVHADAA